VGFGFAGFFTDFLAMSVPQNTQDKEDAGNQRQKEGSSGSALPGEETWVLGGAPAGFGGDVLGVHLGDGLALLGFALSNSRIITRVSLGHFSRGSLCLRRFVLIVTVQHCDLMGLTARKRRTMIFE
jgi:hypothetical protein